MGSGKGKVRRAKAVHYGVSGAEANFRLWEQFVERDELAEMTVADYYEIRLPEYGENPEHMKHSRCSVAMELLRDFVETGAIKLPDNVSVDEFSFDIEGPSLVLVRKSPYAALNQPVPRGVAGGSEVVTNSTSKYLHNNLELSNRGVHTLFSQLHDSIFALVSDA